MTRYFALTFFAYVGVVAALAPVRLDAAGATLSGKVQTEDGVVRKDSRVVIRNHSDKAKYRVDIADVNGNYRIEHIAPGKYDIIGCDGTTFVPDDTNKAQELKNGDNKTLDLFLRRPASRGALRGVIRTTDGRTASNAQVTVTFSGCDISTVTTDASGTFSAPDLPGRAQVGLSLFANTRPINAGSTMIESASTANVVIYVAVDAWQHPLVAWTTATTAPLESERENESLAGLPTLSLVASEPVNFSAELPSTQQDAPDSPTHRGEISVTQTSASTSLLMPQMPTMSGSAFRSGIDASAYHGDASVRFGDRALDASDYFHLHDLFGIRRQIDKPRARSRQFDGMLRGPVINSSTFSIDLHHQSTQSSAFVLIPQEAVTSLSAHGVPAETGDAIRRFNLTSASIALRARAASHELTLKASAEVTDQEGFLPFGGLVARSRGGASSSTDWLIEGSDHLLSSVTLVNTVTATASQTRRTIYGLDPACAEPCSSVDLGGPDVEIVGIASAGRNPATPESIVSSRFDLADALTMVAGTLLVKSGFTASVSHNSEFRPWHFGAQYLFGPTASSSSPLDALASNAPSKYVQSFGNPSASFWRTKVAAFVQGDWRLSQGVTARLGIRYERFFEPHATYSVPDVGGRQYVYPFPGGHNDFAPRAQIIFDAGGDGKTVFDVGLGIYYEDQISKVIGPTMVLTGTDTGSRTLVTHFPQPIVADAWAHRDHRLSEREVRAYFGGTFPSAVLNLAPALGTPYFSRMNVGASRRLGDNLSIDVTAHLVNGYRQLTLIDYNPLVGTLGPLRRPNDVENRAGTSGPVIQVTDARRTWSKSGTIAVTRRFNGRYQAKLSYTFEHDEDSLPDLASGLTPEDNGRGRNPNDPRGLPIGFDPNGDKATTADNRPHRFYADGLYQLPWNLQVFMALSARSGRPFTPLAGVDLNNDGDGWLLPGPDRARIDPLDPSTSVKRNSQRLPVEVNVDASLSKSLTIGRGGSKETRTRVDLSVEGFNLLNRSHFIAVDNIFGSGAFPSDPARDQRGRATYGRYTMTSWPRRILLTGKVTF